ncbi:hypothetical protein GCM10009557_05780 [Virgisporangium ochraceum]|uniref:Holin n=1 Tax=Virgisporangium ochraceum TaxID=65505 RepID=A0A8J4E8J6_9ACTN|nr:hypothetical protein [Virgisporangium ochraceum]GIJ66235.1 hypothetical protein Voc01_011520 [Virgisporangium ochraceum]
MPENYPIVRTTKAKAWAAGVGSAATVVASVFADNVLDTSEVGGLVAGIVAAVVTVATVYKVPNRRA